MNDSRRLAALLHAFAINCDGPGHSHDEDANDLMAAGVSLAVTPPTDDQIEAALLDFDPGGFVDDERIELTRRLLGLVG